MTTQRRKQTTASGDVGENLVRIAMDSIGVKFRRQQEKKGRGFKWKPDFVLLKKDQDDWKDSIFVEVKAQFVSGSADDKIAGQVLRAHYMGLRGYFVLISHAHRDAFNIDKIRDIQQALTELHSPIKVIQGTDALILELKAQGYAGDTPNAGHMLPHH